MRLFNSQTYEFQEFTAEDRPPYAILSHTWGDDEVSFQDMVSPGTSSHTAYKHKAGWHKIEQCCRRALDDGIEFVWVDTCCIDKTSSAELQESINSMFRWYESSTECYVFLADFDRSAQYRHQGQELEENAPTGEHDAALPGLAQARWFTRGWILQELLAPESVRFFDAGWREFGDKVSLRREVAAITGIGEHLGLVLGVRQAVDTASNAQRMSWASRRVTTRVEDTAYCLLGIFDINMPLLYGEGAKAFQRLQEEIMKVSADQSLLAWGLGRRFSSSGVYLPRSLSRPLTLADAAT